MLLKLHANSERFVIAPPLNYSAAALRFEELLLLKKRFCALSVNPL
ncbi:MAG: hypothetical protein IKR85_09330 [Clostridia bacterium]|nr:hypothetical protein [Clostridia bacterium]